jgi:membrane-associated protease RseP (regulator of RpoE activity)
MFRYPLVGLFALLVCCLPDARGQNGQSKAPGDKNSGSVKPLAPLGLTLEAVPDLLYEHLRLPTLQRGQGIVIGAIALDSPAADSGLLPHDIVLTCNGTAVHDGAQFIQLVEAALPEKKARLTLVRGGKEMRLSARFKSPTVADTAMLKGVSKPGGPPELNVKAEPLDGGKLKVTFSFYSESKGKLDQVSCEGSFREIQAEVSRLNEEKRIPVRVQELVEVALKQIREHKSP